LVVVMGLAASRFLAIASKLDREVVTTLKLW
jgi:hypothetical protein